MNWDLIRDELGPNSRQFNHDKHKQTQTQTQIQIQTPTQHKYNTNTTQTYLCKKEEFCCTGTKLLESWCIKAIHLLKKYLNNNKQHNV